MADPALFIEKVSLATLEVANQALSSGPEAVSEKASLGERLSEGVMYLVPGLLIVLGLLAMLALVVELMVWLEKKRKERLKAQEDTTTPAAPLPDAVAVEGVVEDSSAEIAAAIGLALHQHFVSQRLAMSLSGSRSAGAVSWSVSGRMEIMSARQRISGRVKPPK